MNPDLDGITHEQTIICRQLFAGHLVDSRLMKGRKNELMISNGNRTEWSPIRSVIIRVITKSDGRAARVRFVYNDLFIREKKKSQVMKERENMH